MGDLNGHHHEWLDSTTKNRHGVAAFDFATVSGGDQLVVGPIHARGGTLDLLVTDIPDLVRVGVVDTPLWRKLFRWLRQIQTCVLVGEFSSNIKSTIIQYLVQYRICSGVTFGLLTILLRF